MLHPVLGGLIHRRPARRTGGGCERKGSGWQGGQGGRGRAATRCGGRAATHLHRGPTAGPSKSHRTLCVALEILLRQGSTRPSSASVTQNFALKQRETDGNNSASVNLRHCVSKTENVEWPSVCTAGHTRLMGHGSGDTGPAKSRHASLCRLARRESSFAERGYASVAQPCGTGVARGQRG